MNVTTILERSFYFLILMQNNIHSDETDSISGKRNYGENTTHTTFVAKNW